ncbi:sensor histidine kinase [Lysobacter zhanggongensis]|uniref:Histidine kinase n=1 Tax=Lysobacter zhanggongensis TaxID=1774951 RepID=A0ABU7YSL4_9GAMM
MELLRALTQPLVLAGLVTWAAVALGLPVEQSGRPALMWSLALAYLVGFVAIDVLPGRWQQRLRMPLLALQAACALALVWLAPRGGTAPVLLVVLVAQLAMALPPRVTVPAVVVLNVALYLLLREAGYTQPLLVTTLYVGFQAFAALTAHYARTAEASRDALAAVNADLLATRALLADSARSNERLRVARELHDVAGHKLTALGLNLRLLEADPALRMRDELRTCRQLSSELLGDLRNLVAAMRQDDGLDLATALHALAAPLPRPSLQLRIDPSAKVTDPAVAEAIVRTVQEALTNAARHAGAERLTVALVRDGDTLRLRIDDDGRLRGPLREGNGLAGMRERLAMLGGRLALSTGDAGALRIDAEIPV